MCRYGRNGVCQSLPVDGVSDMDYEHHIMRDHVEVENGNINESFSPYSRLSCRVKTSNLRRRCKN